MNIYKQKKVKEVQMARFMCGDAVQGVRKKIKGTVTEVHVVADSISYTLVSDDKQLLRAEEGDLVPYRSATSARNRA